jgi:hypothetical protein
MEKFEQSLVEAIHRGEELEYGVFDSAMDDLLVFRAKQVGIPQRKLRRRIDKCEQKHRKDRRPCRRMCTNV